MKQIGTSTQPLGNGALLGLRPHSEVLYGVCGGLGVLDTIELKTTIRLKLFINTEVSIYVLSHAHTQNKIKRRHCNLRKVVFHKTLSGLKHDPKTFLTSDLIFKIFLFFIAVLHTLLNNYPIWLYLRCTDSIVCVSFQAMEGRKTRSCHRASNKRRSV